VLLSYFYYIKCKIISICHYI